MMTEPMPEDPDRSPGERQPDAEGREQLVANAVAECLDLLSQGETHRATSDYKTQYN